MRYKLLFLVFLSISFQSYGFQSSPRLSKIRLSDGSTLKVNILSIDADHNVTVAVIDSLSITIPAEKVFKTKAPGYVRYNYQPTSNVIYGTASFGLMFGRSNEFSGLRAGVAMNANVGYQLSDLVGVGLGAGAEFVNELILAPLYVRFDGVMNKRRVAPMYNLDIGGSFAWHQDNGFDDFNDVKGGWFLRPGIGLIFHNLNSSLYFKLSYQIQSITYTSSDNWLWRQDPTYERKEERLMRNLNYTFGIRF